MTLILENIIQIKKIYRHRSPTSAIISDVKKAKQRKAIHQMTSYDEADEHPPLPIKKPTSITTVENKNDNQLDANDTDHEGRFLELTKQDNPPASLIKRLPTNQAFPQLQYLTFGSRRFMLTPPELVAKQILSWLDALLFPTSKLVILHLNRRCSFFLTRPPTARDVFRMLLDQHVQSMNHHSPAKIIIDSNEEVIIWL
ncbi:unnamed protein product [Rotaria sordida]|uniref:Uncharacterized protein n=1 Tax=Rotaria sordida TaxID=392033 RepID=A0A815A0H9_9BILA|nr:unnamed protein product [Rotaria sordida]CAF1564359.1 unnamed protein product [Rotaria sordida]